VEVKKGKEEGNMRHQ